MSEKIGLVVCGNSGVDYLKLDYPVRLIRSTLNLAGKEYEDYVDIQAKEFYETVVNNPDIDISTSQTSTGKIASVYEELREEGYTDIITVVISSKPIFTGINGGINLWYSLPNILEFFLYFLRLIPKPQSFHPHLLEQSFAWHLPFFLRF